MVNINDLLSHIRPKKSEIESVARAKDNLIKVIEGKAKQNNLPKPKAVFLIGSYQRDTKISPLNDVDLFYVLGYAKSKGNDFTVTDCSFDFDWNFRDVDDYISSIKVLELVKRELLQVYRQSEIKRNNEVINVYLRSYKVGFDIAPVFEITNGSYYIMPNGGRSTTWKNSNPKKDVKILDKLNQKHNYCLKNTIRIAKYWFKQKRITSPRSYHLESLMYYIFTENPPIRSYKDSLLTFYRNVNYKKYLKRCPDPTELSDDLSSGLSNDDIRNIVTEANKAIANLYLGESAFIKYVAPGLYR